MTISDRILETNLFKSGESFGPLRMAKALNVTRQAADLALRYLLDKGLVERSGKGLYCKARDRHWVHQARLNDAKALHAARVLV